MSPVCISYSKKTLLSVYASCLNEENNTAEHGWAEGMLKWLLRRTCIHSSGIAVLLWSKIVLCVFWWVCVFCCCCWFLVCFFFPVSSKNGHLQTQQRAVLRVLWAALSRSVFVPGYQHHKLIYYRDMLRSTFPLWEKTPDLAAQKPPHLTFKF